MKTVYVVQLKEQDAQAVVLPNGCHEMEDAQTLCRVRAEELIDEFTATDIECGVEPGDYILQAASHGVAVTQEVGDKQVVMASFEITAVTLP